MKIHNPHPERTKLVFPNGFPQEFTLEDINPRLERVGLIAKSKFPGISYSIETINQQPNRCFSGKCREPLCRSLHGELEEKISWWANQAAKNIRDDLFLTTVRLATRFRVSGPVIQNISLKIPVNLDFYLYTRDFKVHSFASLIDVDDLLNVPVFQVDTHGDLYTSSVAQLAMQNYTQGNMSWQHLVDVVPLLTSNGEDE